MSESSSEQAPAFLWWAGNGVTAVPFSPLICPACGLQHSTHFHEGGLAVIEYHSTSCAHVARDGYEYRMGPTEDA